MAQTTHYDLQLDVGGSSVSLEVDDVEVISGKRDADFKPFGSGTGYVDSLKLRIAQDLAAGSMWRKVFDTAGTVVAFKVKGYGNTTATPTQPHLTGYAKIKRPEGTLFGGEYDPENDSPWTIEVTWPVTTSTGVPTTVTLATA